MSDHGRDGTQRPGAASGDPGHDGIRLVSQVGPGRQDSLAGGWTPGASGGIPPPGCVVPGAGGQAAVAGSPAGGCKVYGEIGGSSGNLGCGDRASLPGRPARYRVIWLVCAQCGAETPRLFYDERDLPLCAGSAGRAPWPDGAAAMNLGTAARQPAAGSGGRFYLIGYLPTYAATLFLLLLLVWAGAPAWRGRPGRRITFTTAWATASHLNLVK